MNDDKRFEDQVNIEDILKEPTKIVIAKIFLQTLKTNGTVAQNCTDIKDLKENMKDKIGWKIFTGLIGFLTVIIILFQVLDYFKR